IITRNSISHLHHVIKVSVNTEIHLLTSCQVTIQHQQTILATHKCVLFCPGAFIVCWTPGLVVLLLDVFCPRCNVLAYEKFFLLLAEFNSAMNPIIYSYRDKEMSATFKQILCCQRNENANGPVEG
uniref:Lysophosphatidic acid receptor 1 n=1 Tax=Latimeria chalumnae TaxID=7897 RepID=H3B029_LATCH